MLPTTHYADISPSGPDVTGTRAGDDENPIKYDTNRGQWYLQVDSSAQNNTIYTTLQAKTHLSEPWIYTYYVHPSYP